MKQKIEVSDEDAFSILHQNLQDSIKQLGWQNPTEIQQKTIPLALSGIDVCGIAKTGQGKTAAYALPALNSLLQKPQPYHTLVVAPTRELAIQISEVFQQLGRSSGLRTAILVGGTEISRQQIELAKRPHVVVGTPGRILDHVTNTKGFALSAIKFLILDECDKLLDMDFERDLDLITKRCPRNRQTLLFTATFSNKIKSLKERTSKAQIIKLSEDDDQKTNVELKQYVAVTPLLDKTAVLSQILNETTGQTLVFANQIVDVEKLFYTLKHMGYAVAMIHGALPQEGRLQNLKQFKIKAARILLATDVAARGLDIDDVTVVVNYSVPQLAKEYVHRVGRTARAGNSGMSVCIVTQTDVGQFQQIEQAVGVRMEKFEYDRAKVSVIRDEVNGAVRMAEIEMKKLKKKETEK